MWKLQSDTKASDGFIGKEEILSNSLYSDQKNRFIMITNNHAQENH